MLLSGYSACWNAFARDYPLVPCVEQLLSFCDEVVVADGGSQDGSYEFLQVWAARDARLRVTERPVDPQHPRWALDADGRLKAHARAQCRGDFCFQADLDEIAADDAGPLIRQLCATWPQGRAGDEIVVALPFVEYWGSLYQVRADIPVNFPRLSRNAPTITHDVPRRARRFDSNGDLCIALYASDSCDYVHRDSYEALRVVPLWSSDRESRRRDPLQRSEWQIDFNTAIEELPTIFHLSWLDIERKLRHYRDHWPAFHASLYDVERADCPPAPDGRAWKDLSDEDVRAAAAIFAEEGPRIMHGKGEVGPTIRVGKAPPRVAWDWIAARCALESACPA